MSKRPLNQFEKVILDKLLSAPFPGSQELRNQLPGCEAESTDDSDNYGSIYLFPHIKKIANTSLRVPVEALLNDSDGAPVNILLHVVDGLLQELEIVRLDGAPLKDPLSTEDIQVILNK